MNNILEIKEKGMFYTKQVFSELLVRNISVRKASNIIELGVGDGSLIKQAIKKWKHAKFTCTDVNSNIFTEHKANPMIEFLIKSGMDTNLTRILQRGPIKYDVAVCNPPYLKVSMKEIKKYKKIIDTFDPELFSKIKLISSEFIFLVQNILLLRNKGILGIIVPDSILTRIDYMPIRQSILERYNLLCSIELPDKIFRRTEAKTHILILKKEKPKSAFVRVCLADKKGIIVNENLVERASLIKRMDFSFVHSNLNSHNLQENIPGGKFSMRVLRGNVTHAELKKLDTRFIHSTTFKNDEAIVETKLKYPAKYSKKNFAEPGDLLMVRVGRGCVGKFAVIKSGRILVSDCIFVFKENTPDEISRFVKFLRTKEGKSFIKMLSHGTCSRLISKGDIEDKLLTKSTL